MIEDTLSRVKRRLWDMSNEMVTLACLVGESRSKLPQGSERRRRVQRNEKEFTRLSHGLRSLSASLREKRNYDYRPLDEASGWLS